MSHVYLERRPSGLRLYLAGDLQFDQADEGLYHEPLGLVPVALAAARAPGRPLRVLILGGGDGLAAREALRVPAVGEVRVVDRDPAVVTLGRTVLAPLNRHALADPRVRVEVRDARRALPEARGLDAIVVDLTYPGDLEGARLFTIETLRAVVGALGPGGVLALNAVSPELTPQAFGCLAATLAAAGSWVVPYAFALPSFQAEGYGRWGLLYAARAPIRTRDLRRLRLPAGVGLTPATLVAGARLPAAARAVMRSAPNRTDELLGYLHDPTPLPWVGPFRPLRFAPRAGAVRPGPRATAAHGFARWLRLPAGHRTLEALLACLPLAHRGQTRTAVLEWAPHAERLLGGLDLAGLLDRLLARAGELPRAWVRELRRTRERLGRERPPLRELLEGAYRVFAVLLLVLLLANLFFPDNLYAKGSSSFSSSRSSSSTASSGDGEPFLGFRFSDPAARFAPYRVRRPAAAGRVLDGQGRPFAAAAVPAAGTGRGPGSAVLALTAFLQLLESGRLAYLADVPGYAFTLEPGRLRVLDGDGREVLALLPGPGLEDEARRQLDAQGPLLDKAILDHRRWLDWVRWGSGTPPGREAEAELASLEGLRDVVEGARERWRAAGAGALVVPRPDWFPVLPGLYVAPADPGRPGAAPALVVVTPEGDVRPRSLDPPVSLAAGDRFVFRLLARRADLRSVSGLPEALDRWVAEHGDALGVRPSPPGAAPGSP